MLILLKEFILGHGIIDPVILNISFQGFEICVVYFYFLWCEGPEGNGKEWEEQTRFPTPDNLDMQYPVSVFHTCIFYILSLFTFVFDI